MGLYGLQKLMYELNRDEALQSQYRADRDSILSNFKLDAEERQAIDDEDIGLLYILGVNGQILMHFAAMCGYAWPDYIQAMRDALQVHGNVRAGIYATTDGQGAI